MAEKKPCDVRDAISKCVIGLVAFFVWGETAAAQKLGNAASLHEAAIANVEAWERGDVLESRIKSCDAVKEDSEGKLSGAYYEMQSWYRTIFDYEQGLVVCFQHHRESTSDFDNEGRETVTDSWSMLKWDREADEVEILFSNGNDKERRKMKASSLRVEDYEATLGRDYRGFWITGSSRLGEFGLAKKYVGYIAAHDQRRHEVGAESGKTIVRFVAKTQGSNSEGEIVEFPNVTTTVFDSKSLMPLKLKTITDFGSNQKSVDRDWSTSWIKMNEIYLLDRATKDSRFRIPYSKKNVRGIANTGSRFHWFSINEEIGGARFDVSNVTGLKDIFPLVDPELAKASTLLDAAGGNGSEAN